MARLTSSGFELNAITNATQDIEWHSGSIGQVISTTTVRSGSYSAKMLGSQASEAIYLQFAASNSNGPYFARVYINIESYPNIQNSIIAIDATGGQDLAAIKLDASGQLQLFDEDGNIGSVSSPLSLGVWYRVELKVDRTGAAGAHIVEGKLEGSVFATSSTRDLSVGAARFYVGCALNVEAVNSGVWYFDDVAINDSTGAFQNSYPGSGKIIHLRPNAAGDVNGFLAQIGGTAGAANNFTRVNEVLPNDATSYNGSAVLSAEDLFNIDDSGIGTNDIVNVVSVGVRMADLIGADATAAFKVELEKTGSGTKAQSGTLVPNSTSWQSNSTAAPKNYPLTAYQDPDGANWTQVTLDSMQIGYIQTSTNIQTIAVSNVWVLVDYTPTINTLTPLWFRSLR